MHISITLLHSVLALSLRSREWQEYGIEQTLKSCALILITRIHMHITIQFVNLRLELGQKSSRASLALLLDGQFVCHRCVQLGQVFLLLTHSVLSHNLVLLLAQ